ncbi:hypothetical protein [Streptomyces cyslabdanicus]|uniref:hypothetical protein n=1 Tax=Streptomyces cyslabdanicus TaxID=1470456 RepID=UPI0040439AD5
MIQHVHRQGTVDTLCGQRQSSGDSDRDRDADEAAPVGDGGIACGGQFGVAQEQMTAGEIDMGGEQVTDRLVVVLGTAVENASV